MTDPDYITSIQQTRIERDARFRSNPRNWLSLAGLFELKEGANSLGGGPANNILLPHHEPVTCATFWLENGKITLRQAAEGCLTLNRAALEDRPLCTDRDGNPDLIQSGALEMMVIKRGEHFFLRVWDLDARILRDFPGFDYYPVDPRYQIMAQFIPYDPPLSRTVMDVIGTEYQSAFAGEARFSVNGTPCILLAEVDDDELLFSFTDLTSKDTTYPGGRHLTSPQPENGGVTLDFNLALNWPCAYTPYATCPIPPQENRLQVRIEAGEKRFLS